MVAAVDCHPLGGSHDGPGGRIREHRFLLRMSGFCLDWSPKEGLVPLTVSKLIKLQSQVTICFKKA